MIKKAQTKLSDIPNVQLLVSDLNRPFTIKDADLVVSVLTLQFLRIESRPRLLKETFQGLREGGAFIMVEKVMGSSPQFDGMWVDLHHNMKRRMGLSDYEISAKARSLRGVLIPLSLEKNIQLIHQAGYQTSDVFFKWYNWAGILAVK